MNNKNTGQDAWVNLITRGLAVPAWLLIAIAIVLILANILNISLPNFLLAVIALVLIVVGLFPIQKRPNPEFSKELSDPDAPGYKITLSNFPDNVAPMLLKIEDREKLRSLDKDREVGEILSVAGDIVFYDNVNNLVTDFPLPVKLTLSYTAEDETNLSRRREALIHQGIIAENVEMNLIPVYLYSSTLKTDDKKPGVDIWMPFQNFSVDKANRTMTMEFKFWGDRPAGWGTKP